MDNKDLEREYDKIFDGTEKVFNLLKIESDSYTREYRTIDISKIGLSEPSKKSRKETKLGLTESIKELGVINPVIVMTTETYGKDLDIDDADITIFDYTLLKGLRRLYGARKNNKTEIDAIVFDFKDKTKGREIALVLGLALGKCQRRTWSELWYLSQTLELQSNFIITPGTLEYLLDLEPGDSMKLKDVMLSDDEEVKEELISNKKTLQQCYNTLQKHRKEINTLEKDDNTGISQVEGSEVLINKDEVSPLLTDDEVSKILEMDDDIDYSSLDLKEIDRTSDVRGIVRQTPGDRKPIDPAIKQATLRRDDCHCKCCGTGGEAWLGVLVYHHVVPVSAGGPDTVDNGLTLCSNCHITLHIYVEGDLVVSDYERLNNEDKETIRNIMKYGNKAIESYKVRKMNKKQIKEADFGSRRHLMPGEGLKNNKIAYNDYKNEERAVVVG